MTTTVSEPVLEKAHRLLVEGRVTVLTVIGREIAVRVAGDHGTYRVVRRRGGWECSCENYSRCSHMHAAMTVTGGER